MTRFGLLEAAIRTAVPTSGLRRGSEERILSI